MSMRTPLARVRGLGSAKEGAHHFWLQRVTAVASLLLSIYLVWLIASLVGADYKTVRAALARPSVGVPLALLVVASLVHMRIGMQVIIEDYVSSEGRKAVALMLNSFFTWIVGAMALYAILKLGFGPGV